jgi:hypothetical protein
VQTATQTVMSDITISNSTIQTQGNATVQVDSSGQASA